MITLWFPWKLSPLLTFFRLLLSLSCPDLGHESKKGQVTTVGSILQGY